MMRGFFGPGNVDGWHHHLGTGGIVGLVLMIVLWAIVIAALILGIRALILHSRRGGTAEAVACGPGGVVTVPPATPGGAAGAAETEIRAAGSPTLQAILEERYAKGEIDRDEFLQRKTDLGLS